MITVTPQTDVNKRELNRLVEQVFYKSIELLGGLHNLAEYRTLTWLPSLARACFAVVLKNEYLKLDNEIADFLGITLNTTRNILRADPDKALYKVEHLDELTEEEKKSLRVHVAGGIAKLAYQKVKAGEQAKAVAEYGHEMAQQALEYCDAPWAYLVLKHTKGVDYPIDSSEALLEKLKDAPISEFKIEEVVQKLEYPVVSPAELLKKIKQAIS